ncbi:MAG: hypothetical protein U0Y10_21280 [Spirosomataceae bacterium]
MKLLGIGSRVRHADYGEGVVINIKPTAYLITFMEHGVKQIKLDYAFEVIDEVELSGDAVSLFDVEQTLSKLLQKWVDVTEIVPLNDKWKGGKFVLKPGRSDLQPYEMPIDTFFHKITMIRDRMRVLEQKINAAKGLSEEEKIDMQQYITRCYGSLTSFNILFKEKSHQFVGEKSGN